jgi:hypothetical protein
LNPCAAISQNQGREQREYVVLGGEFCPSGTKDDRSYRWLALGHYDFMSLAKLGGRGQPALTLHPGTDVVVGIR